MAALPKETNPLKTHMATKNLRIIFKISLSISNFKSGTLYRQPGKVCANES